MKKELFSKFAPVPEEQLTGIFTAPDATEASSLVEGAEYTCDPVIRYVKSDGLDNTWKGVGIYDAEGNGIFVSPKAICGVTRRGSATVRYNDKALKGDLLKALQKGLKVKFLERREVETNRYVNGVVDGTEMRNHLFFEVIPA